MNTQLLTPRLWLRQFDASDFEAYAQMLGDPDTMRMIGNGNALTPEEAWKNLAQLIGHWNLRGYGLYAVEHLETGRLIGRVGLYQPLGWPGLEIGWLIERTHRRQGYASEAARAVVQEAAFCFPETKLISLIHPQNIASMGVATSLGAHFERIVQVGAVKAHLYRLPIQKTAEG